MGLFRTSLFVVLSCAVMSVQAANFNKAKDVKTKDTKYGEVYQYSGSWEIPEKPPKKPNKATLQAYLDKYIYQATNRMAFKVDPSGNAKVLIKDLKTVPYIQKQLNSTALLTYLLYENGKISVDELTPEDRFGSQVKNSTPLLSASVGKTFVSYLLGHAICKGVIEGLDSTVSDWPLLQGTLYQNQKLIDLVNMRAGDQKIATRSNILVPVKKNINREDLRHWMAQIRDTDNAQQVYNYNSFPPNLVANYINFKTDNGYQKLTTEFLTQKIGIEHPVYFITVNSGLWNDWGRQSGVLRSTFYMSRYDYLRMAIEMLNDWDTETCEGKYLKELWSKRQPKTDTEDKDKLRSLRDRNWPNVTYDSYAGFFHTDPHYVEPGRHVMAMDGYGGQIIVIDFDEKRIIATNAIHLDYDWKKIVRDVIKTGKL
jgi:CubicO group peptidase (beta-lactamase class C family)